MKLSYTIDPLTGYLYHKNKQLSSIGLFRDEVGKILGLERSMVNWRMPTMVTLPGGKAEKKDIVIGDIIETLKNTCIRESEEESGLYAEKLNFVDIHETYHNSKPYIMAFFDVVEYNGNILEFPTEEHLSYGWFSNDIISKDQRRGGITKKIISDYSAVY